MKFAMNDANFSGLDDALSRVRRPTIEEYEEQNRKMQLRLQGLNVDEEDGDILLGDQEAYPNDEDEDDTIFYKNWPDFAPRK